MKRLLHKCRETFVDLLSKVVVQLNTDFLAPGHAAFLNLCFENWPGTKVARVSISVDDRFSNVIVFAGDELIEISIHVFCDTATSKGCRLSNTLVKESTARVKNSPIQTVEVNLFNQLSLVPECDFFCIFCFLLLGL